MDFRRYSLIAILLGLTGVQARIDEMLEPRFILNVCESVYTCDEGTLYRGYLEGGAKGIRKASFDLPFDRMTLVRIKDIEEELRAQVEPKYVDVKHMKELDAAHAANVVKVEALNVAEPVWVTSGVVPEPRVVVDEEAEEGFNDILLFLEKDEDNGGKESYDVKIPFQFEMPNQASPSSMEAPSQSLYERR